MNKKLLYSAPEAELLVVKFEEGFLQSITSVPGAPSKDESYQDLNDGLDF